MVLLQKVTATNLQPAPKSASVAMFHERAIDPDYANQSIVAKTEGKATVFEDASYHQVLFSIQGISSPVEWSGFHEDRGKMKGVEAIVFLRLPAKGAAMLSPIVQLRDHTWVPFVPNNTLAPHRNYDEWYPADVDTGVIHLLRLGALPANKDLADDMLNDQEDNLLYQGWGMDNEPVYMPQATAYLMRDDPKAVVRDFYSNMACAFSHTVREPLEHRWAHQLMLVAFFCNGMGPFGLKVLAANNLSDPYHYQFIAAYYFCGFLLIVPVVLLAGIRPSVKELVIGAAMGAFSFAGTLFTAFALERGTPGEIVFPITTGGSLIVVAIAGISIFKEKIARRGIVGILIGILALALLSAS